MIEKDDPRLTAFVLGELPQAEMEEIKKRIDQDPDLQAEVDEISQVCGNLTSAFSDLPQKEEPQLSDLQRQEVLSRADQLAAVEKEGHDFGVKQSTRRSFGRTVAQIALAITVVIGVTALARPAWFSPEEWKQAFLTKEISEESSGASLNLDGATDNSSEVKKEKRGRRFEPTGSNSGGGFGGGGFDEKSEVSLGLGDDRSRRVGSNFSGQPGKDARLIILESADKETSDLGGSRLVEPSNLVIGHQGAVKNIELFQNGKSHQLFRATKGKETLKTFGIRDRSNSEGDFKYKNEEYEFRGDGVAGEGGAGGGINLSSKNVNGVLGKLFAEKPRATDRKSGEVPSGRQVAGGKLSDGLGISANKNRGGQTGKNNSGKRTTEALLGQKLAVIQKKNKKQVIKRLSWKRVKASPNATRLVLGNEGEVRPNGLQMDVQIDGFRARVVVDYLYYNPYDQAYEGKFKMRLANGSSPYYFAFGESRYHFAPQSEKDSDKDIAQNFISPSPKQFVSLTPDRIRSTRKDTWSNVKEARMVPRVKAAFAYKEVTRQRVDPALVEWAGAGVFNARVFPLSPKKMHRIVMAYDVDMKRVDDRWVLDLDIPEDSGLCQLDCRITTTDDVVVSPKLEVEKFEETALFHRDDAKAGRYRVSIPATKGIVLYSSEKKSQTSTKDEKTSDLKSPQGSYFATSVVLPTETKKAESSSHAVFMLDTSLSSQPEKFNVWLNLLDSVLEKNEDSLHRFALVHFDVHQRWWKNQYVKNDAENRAKLREYCQGLALEGATDLDAAFEKLTLSPWVTQDARPDVFLLSDGVATWGQKNIRMMEHKIGNGDIGRLFAYQVGMQGTSIRTLRYLAGSRGGAVFSITNEKEIDSACIAHRNSPWELMEIKAEGATDVMTAGRVQWIYPGQELKVVGRGLPSKELIFKVRKGTIVRSITVPVQKKERSPMAFRTYGQVAVGQLENLGHVVEKFSTAYARNFRVTGQTCSLLMLETEAEYKRFQINPENDRFVVQSKNCSRIVAETLEKQSKVVADNKAAMWHFIGKLSDVQSLQFSKSTDLELLWPRVGEIPSASPLSIKGFRKKDSQDLKLLDGSKLVYGAVSESAKNIRTKIGNDDAIRRLSSVIEQNPGNVDLVRDVAFSVMELGRADQAFFLLYDLAKRRPFDGSLYLDMADCLNQMGNPSLALVMNDIALRANFSKAGFKEIAKVRFQETMAVLKSHKKNYDLRVVQRYADSRLSQLGLDKDGHASDIVVSMSWNTDRTDVDLHVIDPDGEDCNFQHTRTKAGGRITKDVTDGYGPEMFFLKDAPEGVYQVKVRYYSSDRLRKGLDSKVYVKVYRNFGRKNQTVSEKR